MESPKIYHPLNTQQKHWDTTFAENEDLFGEDPSAPARISAELFKKAGVARILELGSG